MNNYQDAFIFLITRDILRVEGALCRDGTETTHDSLLQTRSFPHTRQYYPMSLQVFTHRSSSSLVADEETEAQRVTCLMSRGDRDR